MKFFIDTANIDEIKKAAELGVLDGVTTNPSLLSKEKGNFREILERIKSLSLIDVDHGLLALSVELFEGVHIDYLFQADREWQIRQMIDCFRKLAIA